MWRCRGRVLSSPSAVDSPVVVELRRQAWVQLSPNFAPSVCLTCHKLRYGCTEREAQACRISHGLLMRPYAFSVDCKFADPQVKVAPSSHERRGVLCQQARARWNEALTQSFTSHPTSSPSHLIATGQPAAIAVTHLPPGLVRESLRQHISPSLSHATFSRATLSTSTSEPFKTGVLGTRYAC